MAEYIKRETFLKDIEERHCSPCKEAGEYHNGFMCAGCWVGDLRSEVIGAPTADVAPVVHGKWDDSGRYTFPSGSTAVRCSNCGCALSESEYHLYSWDYCPICGARMDGGACNQVCKYNTPDRGCVAGELRARCDLANVTGGRGNGEAG